ncbi:hypothetical protein [Streptomyces sp. NPDC060022]|uniref:hypothetical protein n=1 Tax=Streptomyces sp. NPDC060022 TaxID=3347039 RepID=UPI003680FD94
MHQRGAGGGLRVAAWVLVPLGLLLAVGGIGYFFTHYQGATVMSEAMEPTYRKGDRLVIEDIDAGEVRRGDADWRSYEPPAGKVWDKAVASAVISDVEMQGDRAKVWVDEYTTPYAADPSGKDSQPMQMSSSGKRL